MVYSVIKLILGFAVKQYFRDVVIHNADKIPKDGPIILLPNHTSAFMDPIVVACQVKRSVNFLTRGESFESPIMSKIFSILHMIPIYRREHTPGQVDKNEDVFVKCFELLEKQGVLMIFPEGVCQMHAQLMPLKTGSARIALGAAARNKFKLNVCLIPVGINYTDPHIIQGKLFINFGDPIYTNEFQEIYQNDSYQGYKSLTDAIDVELRKRIVIVNDRRWVSLAEKTEKIIKSQPLKFEGILENKDNRASWFIKRQQILKVIDFIKKEDGEDSLNQIEQKVDSFFFRIERLGLKKKLLNPLGKYKSTKPRKRRLAAYFIVILPFFLIGLAMHIVPYKLTGKLADRIVKRDDFRGSVLLALGLLIFAFWGFLIAYISYQLTSSALLAIIVALSFPVIGLIAFRYYVRLTRLISDLKVFRRGQKGKIVVKKLEEERQELIDYFINAQRRYEDSSLESN